MGANFCVDLTARASKPFGPERYVPVVGTARGVTFHTTLVPRGDSAYRVFLDGPLREGAALEEGDTVELELAPDLDPPEPPPPLELLNALDVVDGGIEAFFNLPDGLRREALRFLENAKRRDTRERRVARIVEMVEERVLRHDGR
ncbi:MAG: YdeI/OmpD-associated family protein [Dehalococcoidia bacterium]